MGETGIKEIHKEILTDTHLKLLKNLSDRKIFDKCYLAGGTALSLRMGWRTSVDFDFFTPENFDPNRIADELRQEDTDGFIVRNIDDGTCDVLISGIQVSCFRYPYRMLNKPEKIADFPGICLASVEDIACMKAVAIGQRGAKKDFFDLYQILNSGMTMQNLARLLKEKYGKNDYAYLYMGMTYFEDAEEELLGNVFTTYSWDEIKRYFTANADGFRDALLDQ